MEVLLFIYILLTVKTIAGTTVTRPVDPCKDKSDRCNAYVENMCTTYVPWATENCQRFCKFCAPLYTTAPPPCTNKLSTCSDYSIDVCHDPRYYAWSEYNCRLHCGLCGDVGFFKKCHYKGATYQEGETWTDGCDYECECIDGQTGRYTCSNKCPIYFNLPHNCSLVQESQQCCKQPRCSTNQHTQTIASSFEGTGSISGRGASRPGEITPPPCADKLRNCHQYGLNTCAIYAPWAKDNCRQYCNLCNVTSTPGKEDKCVFNREVYSQDDKWQVGCDTECVCDDGLYGYYRCYNICPTYSNLPSGCREIKKSGDCCPTIVCKIGYLQTSSVNSALIGGSIASVKNVTNLYTRLTTIPVKTSTQPNSLTQCIDSTFIKCIDSHICRDTYLRRLCPVTCKLCVRTTTPPCVDVTYIDCADGHVCGDAYLRQKCPVTCGICAGSVKNTTPTWIAIGK
ncbi:extracellular matrix organizing protein FRAS1-like [Mytilus edulis]|uniref:extracellular matrix organizing protein FRAS1-like n=1 Tax=Mytilus edulis TaxID=6550 RepID=UPI0039EF8219